MPLNRLPGWTFLTLLTARYGPENPAEESHIAILMSLMTGGTRRTTEKEEKPLIDMRSDIKKYYFE